MFVYDLFFIVKTFGLKFWLLGIFVALGEFPDRPLSSLKRGNYGEFSTGYGYTKCNNKLICI